MSKLVKVSDKAMQSVLAPQITEKATMVADKFNKVVFKVTVDATKADVKSAIEAMFKVEVAAVNLLNMNGKIKRSDWKKAYVSLKPGQEINFTGE